MNTHFIALYAGTPIKLHTNLCGKWFAMTDEQHATHFKCEQTAVSQCALHGVPSVTIIQRELTQPAVPLHNATTTAPNLGTTRRASISTAPPDALNRRDASEMHDGGAVAQN